MTVHQGFYMSETALIGLFEQYSSAGNYGYYVAESEIGYAQGYAAGYAAGYAVGFAAGYAAGFAAGEAAHATDYDDGFAAGEAAHATDYATGYAAGHTAGFTAGEAAHASDYGNGYAAGFAAGVASVPFDETPASITVVSPTPGVAAGEPGGFPSDPAVAKQTAIVLQIDDVGGLAYAAIFARFDGAERRVPIFRRGAFEPGYKLFSSVEVVDADTTRLHVRADVGWQSLAIAFDVDVVDSGGNVT